jgi:hypothetical protein
MHTLPQSIAVSYKIPLPEPDLLASHPKPTHPPCSLVLFLLQSQNVMGTPQWVLAPWALLLLALQLAGASHVIHRSLEAEAPSPPVHLLSAPCSEQDTISSRL